VRNYARAYFMTAYCIEYSKIQKNIDVFKYTKLNLCAFRYNDFSDKSYTS